MTEAKIKQEHVLSEPGFSENITLYLISKFLVQTFLIIILIIKAGHNVIFYSNNGVKRSTSFYCDNWMTEGQMHGANEW